MSSTPDPELQERMKGQLAVAESRARQEAEAKKHAQSQLEAALREKDQHLERLEDADRVRISLEGRLQETRTMLQILSPPLCSQVEDGRSSNHLNSVRPLTYALGTLF